MFKPITNWHSSNTCRCYNRYVVLLPSDLQFFYFGCQKKMTKFHSLITLNI